MAGNAFGARLPASVCCLLLAVGIATETVNAAGRFDPADERCRNLPETAPSTVRENCFPGKDSREWDVSGAGDLLLQGFAGNISYANGEVAEFYVSSVSPSFRVDIYRLGYYGGAGARLLDSFAVRSTFPQPDCLWDPVTLLYDCSNWRRSFTWAIPADSVSGLFFARLVRPARPSDTWRADGSNAGAALSGGVFRKTGVAPGEDPLPSSGPHAYGRAGTGRLQNALHEPHASHVWFVVRNDDRRADVLFQTSDTTWQAYNRWGGVGTYGGSGVGHGVHDYGGQGLDRQDPKRRAYKVSYNRPLVVRDYRSINMPLGAEYPMIRFLEKHGYDVNYAAGVDTDRLGSSLLGRHRLFLSVGHDEYWSGQQRANVESARDRQGMHLAFLSGNEVFWRVRWEDDYRTMVCYKESQADFKLDPQRSEWTGTFRDSRPFNPLGPQPENALTGQIFTVNAWRNDPLVVPTRYRLLRFWRNTSVAASPPGRPVVLLRGLLGHEWDEDLNNGHRPAGLIHLSETAVDNVMYIQDFGSVYDSGSGVHHLTLYRAASGALVFGAGTVQWAWGLDGHHDGGSGVPPERANPYSTRLEVDILAPEPAVQQATVNLLAEMDIQPHTLERSPDLLLAAPSADDLPPKVWVSEVSITVPTGNSLHGGAVSISVAASDRGGGQVAMVEVSVDGGSTWHQAEPEGGEDVGLGGLHLWQAEISGMPSHQTKDLTASGVLARATDDSLNTGETSGITAEASSAHGDKSEL